jgi:hypothetical protein
MSIRLKLVAVVGALAVLFVAPTEAFAAKAPKLRGPFAVGASQNSYNVTCAPGASSGTSSIQLRLTRSVKRVMPAEVGYDNFQANRYVASWQGGSIVMKSLGRFYPAAAGVTFPCPASSAGPGTFVVTVQPYNRKGSPIGKASTYVVVTHRVGSPS